MSSHKRFARVGRLMRLAGFVMGLSCSLGEQAFATQDSVPPDDVAVKVAQTVMEGVLQSTRAYRLSAGDSVEILFHVSSAPESDRYVIGVGDQIDVDFVYQQDLNRTLTVRPDGRITLPRKGELVVAGHTVDELSRLIESSYGDVLRNPVVSIDLRKFRNRSQELLDAVDVQQRGQPKRAIVSPDGRISVPMLAPVVVAGRSVEQVSEELSRRYQENYRNVQVSVLLDNLAGNRVFVFGEVRNPGAVAMTGPISVLQALAQAGGPVESGSIENVRVVVPDSSGEPKIKTVNLSGISSQTTLSGDEVLPANATVYVPPTALATMGRFVDQVVRRIFTFSGIGLGFNYDIRRQTGQ